MGKHVTSVEVSTCTEIGWVVAKIRFSTEKWPGFLFSQLFVLARLSCLPFRLFDSATKKDWPRI